MLPSDYPTGQGSPAGTRGAMPWVRGAVAEASPGDGVERERGSKGCLSKKGREGQSMVGRTRPVEEGCEAGRGNKTR